VELRQPVPRRRGRAEEGVGDVLARQHAVLREQIEDRPVPTGQAAGDVEDEVVAHGATTGLR